ncbi:MAG: FAD-binding oxidoreductase [Ilumatobacteraceae bacterium]
MARADEHVVIVGGAIIGSFTAWSLRTAGFAGRITVVERDPSYEFSSTARSAASIRTQFGTPTNVRMSLFAIDLFRNLDVHFGRSADIGYVERGYLILGGPESVDERRRGVELQLAEGADVVALDPGEVSARFPFLDVGDIGIGTFGTSGEGWFDAWLLLALVRTAARELGVVYVTGTVDRIDVEASRVVGVGIAGQGPIGCDWCVLAAGPAAGRVAGLAGIDLPVRPRKRTVFSFKSPVFDPAFPMLFDTSGIWVRPDGAGFIGGVQPLPEHDHDADGDFEPHGELFDDVFWPALVHRIPAMDRLRLTGAWAGHYEVNDLDHNGVIGPHDVFGNLIFATGFSGHGVMHAPATGRGVAELIMTGRYQTIDLTPLNWERIRDASPMVESVIY